MMQTENQPGMPREAVPKGQRVTENRWCEKHGYVIDVDACRARALLKRSCGICLSHWQQLSLPFPEPFKGPKNRFP